MRHLIAAALVVGCGASSTQLQPGLFSVSCRRSQSNCYEEAARVCPSGFDVLDSADGSDAVASKDMYGDVTVRKRHRGELLVKCH